jgi:hypothetical protein
MLIRMKCGPIPRSPRRKIVVEASPVAKEERADIGGQRREAPAVILVKPAVMSGGLLRRSARKTPRAMGRV